ncbi:MAG TPA: hypothetical protein PLF25_09785 [Accumulibacter sp.]|jgi:hypothetical protein|nr:hypothetical protein [Accumulibacter sp.]HQO30543.1 hypothetical protein [Accumulibacter sp.]
MHTPDKLSAADLASRRAASRRLAWVLGAVALAIYVLGFIYYRS